jgi:acylphosphatase
MDARARVVFRGHVQGVYFRANCQQKAMELGLVGFVRNRQDGTVEAVFEGERSLIEECIEWNATRQPRATVDRADVAWETPTGEFSEFEVRH